MNGYTTTSTSNGNSNGNGKSPRAMTKSNDAAASRRQTTMFNVSIHVRLDLKDDGRNGGANMMKLMLLASEQ